MRKKIVQRAGKALLQLSLYSLLVGTLSIPVSGWAAGWTPAYGLVTYTRPHVGGFLVYMDPAAASNVNACTAHNALSPIFQIVYPTSGAPSEAQKVIISQISLAIALGKPIKIYSASCTSSNYNNIDQIWLNAN
jgi:hypothetical protein